MTERIGVLLTSCGGLAVPGIVDCLRAVKDYDFHIVGVDMRAQAIGAHFVDSFHTVPAGLDPSYPQRIMEVAQQERVNVIVPGSDEEVLGLCRHRERFLREGIALLCSSVEATENSIDKGQMLTYLQNRGILVPEFYLPASLDEMDEAVKLLGYPDQEVVLKPTRAHGARGFWILSEKQNGQDLILNERGLQHLPYRAVRSLLAERPTLPRVVVMQYLRGPDFNVDVLAWQGETLYGIPIQRIVPQAGPVQVGRIVHDSRIDTMVQQTVSAFGFSYNVNVELAYPDEAGDGIPLVYEINPRISAPIAVHRAAGINLLLFGILLGVGREIIRGLSYREITMQRCWREVFS